MTASYALLVRRAPARRLIYALAASCVSFGMVSLTLLLTIERTNGSYADGGYAVAAFALAAGASAPFRGRLVDRHGAHWLVMFSSGYAASLVAFDVVAHTWPRTAPLLVLSFLTGLSAPPLFASARSAWPSAVEPELVRRGYAVTSLLADVGQVGGPALAGGLVLVSTWAAPIVAAAACLGACLLSASARLSIGPRPAPMPSLRTARGFQALLGVSILLGAAGGTIQVAVPTVAGREHAGSLAGPLLAAFAFGSVLGALWFGTRQWHGSAFERYLVAALALAAFVALLAAVTAPAALAPLLVLAGLAFGPATVSLFELLDVLAPGGGTEALTWVTSAEAGGAAAGSAAAGALAARGHAPIAFLAAAGLLAVAAAGGLAFRRERRLPG